MVVNERILQKVKELIGDSAPQELYEVFEQILEQQSKYDQMEKEPETVKKFYQGILEINSKNEKIMNYVEKNV